MSGSGTATVQRNSVAMFALVLGILLGALVATVAIPRRQPEQVLVGGGDSTESRSDVSGGSGADDGTSASPGAEDASVGEDAAVGDQGDPSGGGSVEGGGTGGRASGGSSVGSSGTSGGSSTAVGVSGDRIRIGVTFPDLGALRALGPEYDNGDVPKQWHALVDRWRREGALPVHGRDIELVFADYNVLQPEEQRAACVSLVKDSRVFMVVAQTYYLVGAECVAREYKTPLLTSDGPNDPIFQRSIPLLFSLGMSEDRILRNLIHWAHRRDLLRDQQVGIYYEDQPPIRDQMNRTVKAELRRLGHDLAAEVTTDQTLGGPQDALAVQQFRSAGVDVALLFTSKGGFMQQAQAQRYRPRYLDSDFIFGTSDTATSTYPREQFDGTLAITGRRVGETSAGITLDPEASSCIANYERFAKDKLEAETAEWAYVLTVCDLGKTLMTGLRSAGRALDHNGLVAGFETLRGTPMNRYAPVTFSPSKHHGVDTFRELRWKADCTCWQVAGPFQPLFVP